MKRFFGKKYIFAVIFFIGILVFTGWNLLNGREVFRELKEEFVKITSVEELEQWIRTAETELAEEIDDGMVFTEIYGAIQNLLMKKEYNGFSYVKEDDGMIYYASVAASQEDYLTYALRVKRAMEAAKQQGAETLFVLPPSKILYGISKMEESLPVNDKNAAQDEMLLALAQCGVPALDLRDMCRESGLTAEDLFYKTDHSWTTEAAFLAAGEIAERIRTLYGDDWDPEGYYCNRENYEAVTYQGATIGSFGRDTGVIYAGYDDYTVLTPKFDTRFIWYNMEKKEEKKGSFASVFVTAKAEEHQERYGNPGNHIYLEGIVSRDRIENPDNPDGPKILCLRDSYFSPVASFLAPMCSSMDMVWARRRQNDIDYEALILEEEYDYLLIENYPYNLNDEAFDYFREN